MKSDANNGYSSTKIGRNTGNLLAVQLNAQESVMAHLSKELHDNINQLIALVEANLHLLADSITSPTETRLVKNITGMVASIAGELQNLSHGLNSNFIKETGLINALQKEATYINDSKKLVCSLQAPEDTRLSPEQELLIYRIAQEAIHNVLKHSRATALHINLKTNKKSTQLTIADNGVGFSYTGRSSGAGLINMKNRAGMLNAALQIQSTPGAGTTISLILKHAIYGRYNNKYSHSR